MQVVFIVALVIKVGLIYSKTADEWKTRIIYQLLTDRFSRTNDVLTPCDHLREYCGGTFVGIQNRLDYITDLGANAIWISPFVENTPGGYHGYWAKNLFKVNPEFGTADDLKALIHACHARDIWVIMPYIYVPFRPLYNYIQLNKVANHMGYPGSCSWVEGSCPHSELLNYTRFVPFNQAEHYHTYCEITNWQNQTEVELCRLAGLPDLNQSNPYTHDTLLYWIRNITVEFDFDGYRIDTTVLVPKPFWAEFQSAGGVFMTGEANNGDNITYLASYQGPLDSVLNFPLYWALRHVFNEMKPMTMLATSLQEQKQHFLDTRVLTIFVDNHDFPRFLNISSQSDGEVMLKNALTSVLLGEGIPILYYGTEQSFHGGYDPNNRESLWPFYNQSTEMFQFIKSLSSLRTQTIGSLTSGQQLVRYHDSRILVFTSGTKHELLVGITNIGPFVSRHELILNVHNIYPDGTAFQNHFDAEDILHVTNGSLSLQFEFGNQLVYVRKTHSTSGSSLPIGYRQLLTVIALINHALWTFVF